MFNMCNLKAKYWLKSVTERHGYRMTEAKLKYKRHKLELGEGGWGGEVREEPKSNSVQKKRCKDDVDRNGEDMWPQMLVAWNCEPTG